MKLGPEKVVDLDAYRIGRELAAGRAVDAPDLRGLDPVHALYVHVHNWVITMAEALLDFKELRKLGDRLERAEEEYMPSGPPMSPLTGSYFWSWALYDASLGLKRETLGQCARAVGRAVAMDKDFLDVVQVLSASYCGLFVHEGWREGRLVLRELVTDEERICICPTGYVGEQGELWYARVVPAPREDIQYGVVFTTPYVIIEPQLTAWRGYLDRTLPKARGDSDFARYRHLMKWGLDPKHWPEYVFEAYVDGGDPAGGSAGRCGEPSALPAQRGEDVTRVYRGLKDPFRSDAVPPGEGVEHALLVVVRAGAVVRLAVHAGWDLVVAAGGIDVAEHLLGQDVVGLRSKTEVVCVGNAGLHDLDGERGIAGVHAVVAAGLVDESLVLANAEVVVDDTVLDAQAAEVDQVEGHGHAAVGSVPGDHDLGQARAAPLLADQAFA